MFFFQAIKPFLLPNSSQMWLRLLRQSHEVEGVLLPQRFLFPALLKLLAGVLRYRLQHPEARLPISSLALLQQALVQQRLYGVHRISLQIVVVVTYSLDGFQRAAALEDCRISE